MMSTITFRFIIMTLFSFVLRFFRRFMTLRCGHLPMFVLFILDSTLSTFSTEAVTNPQWDCNVFGFYVQIGINYDK